MGVWQVDAKVTYRDGLSLGWLTDHPGHKEERLWKLHVQSIKQSASHDRSECHQW